MPDCLEQRMQFGRLGWRVIEAAFDGGDLSSDGGLMLLRRGRSTHRPKPRSGRSDRRCTRSEAHRTSSA